MKIYLIALLLFAALFLQPILFSAPLRAQSSFDLVQFSDSTKYGWRDLSDRLDFRADFTERQNLLQIYNIESQSVHENMLKSAIFPGWGQFSTGHFTKGQILLGSNLVLFGTSLYFYDRALGYHRSYEKATQVDEIEKFYKKAQEPFQYSVIFLGFATLFWAYNVYDVIGSTQEYNIALWDRIMRENYRRPIRLTPQGVEIEF